MRVIAGKYKHRRLFSLDGDFVRPTGDKVKEAIFAILYSKGKLDGDFSVLDLFSGSGSLGIEALSRGAKEAVFCDNNNKSIALTKENLAHIGVDATVLCSDFLTALLRFKNSQRFDIVFIDPPYKTSLAQKALDAVLSGNILKPDGIAVVERALAIELKTDEKEYITDERRYGKTLVSFVSVKDKFEQDSKMQINETAEEE